MPLLETLVLDLGPAIAKSILKVWLKDTVVAADTSAALVEIIKSKTSDVIAQRRANRQFEEISESVAQNLLIVFEVEGKNLSDSEQSAVALAVAEALNKAKIDPSLLANRNLEPKLLAEHILGEGQDLALAFSEFEESFYKRIIHESSRLIVDIASQLPSFVERTFSEVLKREDHIIDITKQVLDEVQRIRQASISEESDATLFENEYRSAVVRNLDKLMMFGLDVSTANRRHRLSVAYVTLSVRYHVSRQRQQDLDQQYGAVPVSVNDVLSRSSRIFVRSMAGSGKTTLLQWIAVRAASQSFPIELSDLDNVIPFMIRLRQHIDNSLPTPQEFPRLVAPLISETMPQNWVHDQLNSGRAIVLIDGVDEVPREQRINVYQWVEDLVHTFPESRFIVTSRPHAVEEAWLDNLAFDLVELQPMNLAAIDEFIDHWHNAVRGELFDQYEIAELSNLSEALKKNLRSERSLYSLATNPLLCAMLCALNRERRQHLPSDRIELFESGCYMLLERRDKESGLILDRYYPNLSYRQKKALIQDLAYWMVRNGWSEVPRSKVEKRLERRFEHFEGTQRETDTADVYRFFVERSGIVRELVVGQMDFAHRTFQEYLAAQAAVDADDLGVLLENANDDRWREVIILATGLARGNDSSELVEGLIKKGDNPENLSIKHRLHLLAIACLETAVELAPNVRTEVHRRMEQLVPPKHVDDAEALAVAGELSLPHLAADVGYSEAVAAACVRTLSLIGGELAFGKVLGYVADEREQVVAELWRAWDAFDRTEYTKQVIVPLASRNPTLSLVRVMTLEGFEQLMNLQCLQIQDCRALTDLSPLSHLENLTELSLKQCDSIGDIRPLSTLSKLEKLTIREARQINDLSPLIGHNNLIMLDISYCDSVTDLSPLAELKRLLKLNITGVGDSIDLGPLMNRRSPLDVTVDETKGAVKVIW